MDRASGEWGVHSRELSAAAAVLQALARAPGVAILAAAATPVSIAEVVDRLGLDARGVARDIGRLVAVGVLTRDGDRISSNLAALGELAFTLGQGTTLARQLAWDSPVHRHLVHGRVQVLPSKPGHRRLLAEALAALLPEDVELTEAEVDQFLGQAGDDVAALRRLVADEGLVARYGSRGYRRSTENPDVS